MTRVFGKEVRVADIWPVRESGAVRGEEERVVRSAERELDCRRAVLYCEFWRRDVSW